MHLTDQRILGVAILVLLAILVGIKKKATGSIIEMPRGGVALVLGNAFNLFFLLVVNPLVAGLLIARQLPGADPTHVGVGPGFVTILEVLGLVMYGAGYVLMASALMTLGRSYQLGGIAPRPRDKMVVEGPYRLVRHPMYTAALSLSAGLCCLTQSGAAVCVFCGYLAVIFVLIPLEEAGLQRAYGEPYVAYQQRVPRLLPWVH